MALRRVTVVYRGRVQGVGFRYTTARLAEALPVHGYVMNLCDGSVRMEAEGKAVDLRRLLDAIEQSELGPGVRGADVHWGESDGRFQGFHIRYQTLE